jgi:hypothetical protein
VGKFSKSHKWHNFPYKETSGSGQRSRPRWIGRHIGCVCLSHCAAVLPLVEEFACAIGLFFDLFPVTNKRFWMKLAKKITEIIVGTAYIWTSVWVLWIQHCSYLISSRTCVIKIYLSLRWSFACDREKDEQEAVDNCLSSATYCNFICPHILFCVDKKRKKKWVVEKYIPVPLFHNIILYLSSASYSRSSGAQPDMMNQVFEKLARTVFV